MSSWNTCQVPTSLPEGTILGTEGIRAAYATGRGRVVIRAKAFVEESARGNRFQIIVTELPYQVKALLLERIARTGEGRQARRDQRPA
ncbi:MAG: hypothetical protein R2848_18405 [Thermomicrobiales bacterium]